MLDWLQNKEDGLDDSMFDPTGKFRRIDAVVSRKRKQSVEDRAKKLMKALDWMRNDGLHPEEETTEFLLFDKHGKISVMPRSEQPQSKDMEDDLNFWRNKGTGNADLYDPQGILEKLDSTLPQEYGQTVNDRAKEVEKVPNWKRDQGLISGEDLDDVPSFDATGSLKIECKI